jgi:hypothetical protein
MELIHYAGGELLTGDAIAKSVLDYAKALAMKDSSDEVEIPIRREDGSLGTAQLLIGPASQLVAETVRTDFEDIKDDELVAQLQRNTARLADPTPIIDGSPSTSDDDFEMTNAIDAAHSEGRKPPL